MVSHDRELVESAERFVGEYDRIYDPEGPSGEDFYVNATKDEAFQEAHLKFLEDVFRTQDGMVAYGYDDPVELAREILRGEESAFDKKTAVIEILGPDGETTGMLARSNTPHEATAYLFKLVESVDGESDEDG